MADRIHLSKADITEVEEEFVLAALRSGWVAPLGPDVDAFEAEVAERVGVRHALALSSGTAALHLALLEIGAAPGRVVVLPSMTFAASANAVTYTGATPVFVDARPEDGNVDTALLVQAVDTLRAEGTDVCAVMTVDLFGRVADYDRITPDLAERGIPFIEDAAEALGASYHGRSAGSFGRASALSFNGNKIMTTSGGGMLLSDDEELIAHARNLSTQAREPAPWYEHAETGYNYRMSNILAALGRGQLSRLDEMIARRREIRSRYAAGLANVPGVAMLDAGGQHDQSNSWLTCITVGAGHEGVDATGVIAFLNHRGIEGRHLWKPMHQQPMFAQSRCFTNGVSADLFDRGITLPSGSSLDDGQIDVVVDALGAALTSGAPSASAPIHSAS